jgi:hypothetical protein
MKDTDTNEIDHNFEFVACLSRHSGRLTPPVDQADRHEKVLQFVEKLNVFYADHGRMPSTSELDVISKTNDKDNGPVELTYELDE